MKKRPQSKLAIFLILSLALTVLCAGALTLSLMPNTQIALATDASFTQVFPTTDYFQSANPSKVSANRSYLLIYDDAMDKLFVRGGGSTQTSVYSTDFENVQNVFAIGSVAFLNCESGCYTLDLTESSATWQARTLPTPTNINYFNSDGTYLYAHSAFGTVSVYDQNLDIAFDADNVQDYDFAGQSTVVTGEGSTLTYSLSTARANNSSPRTIFSTARRQAKSTPKACLSKRTSETPFTHSRLLTTPTI